MRSFARSDALRDLADSSERDPFDVVVVGGGITGAGCALDAASRGLRTALVERDDFASGTSSKSSKLIHGGLRYLQQREVGLVYEALQERQRLRTNAPHLVHDLPFLIPVFTRDGLLDRRVARALGAAMWAYDLTGGIRIGKLHDRIDAAEALEYLPVLRADRLHSAYVYYDCEADDARLTLAIARTASKRYGAVVANGVALTGFDKGPDGMVRACLARTTEGDDLRIAARLVVNATGVWADTVRALDDGVDPRALRPAKGVHLTFPRHLVGATIAAVLPVPGDRRSVFLVPHGDLAYLGTTDTDHEGSIDEPVCTPDDIDYLLSALRATTTATVGADDVLGTWAGLRPLVRGAETARTSDLSRRHQLGESASGVLTITGGKLTTYRKMAADTIDRAARILHDRDRRLVPRGSQTRALPLVGSDDLEGTRRDLSRSPHLDEAQVDHLMGRHGADAGAVLAILDERPGLAAPLVPGLPYLAAEAVHAVRHEMARGLADVLDRRTRARILDLPATWAAVPRVAELVGDELDWPPERRRAAVDEYRAELDEERRIAELGSAAPTP